MARENALLYSLNVGAVSPLALARVDLSRMRLACETFHNFLPQAIGPAQVRPGLEFLTASDGNNPAKYVPFIFSATDTALIELTNLKLRIIKQGVALQRLPATNNVINGNFSSATGWTLTTTNGGEATINTTFANALQLRLPVRGSTATAGNTAGIVIAAGDLNELLAMRVVVTRGPVIFRLGTTAGADDLIPEQALPAGVHSLTFITPSSGIFITFRSTTSEVHAVVDDVNIETGAAPFELTAPWTAAQLDDVRHDQSGDVVFVAHANHQTRRIERRTTDGWSLVFVDAADGPFIPGVTASDVKLGPSVTLGNGTMSASRPFFKPTHVGALFRMWHNTQSKTAQLGGDNEFTESVLIRGPSSPTTIREVTRAISGTYTGSLDYQEALDPFTDFYTVGGATSGSTGTVAVQVNGSNITTAFRVGFLSTPGWGSGIATVTLSSDQRSGRYGIVRVTGFTSSVLVDIEVLKGLDEDGTSGITADWEEGEWSDFRGWPSAVALFDGRLWLAKADRLWGSVSDDFSSFDADVIGDSASIQRSIASGAVNEVKWMLGLEALCLGTAGAEPVVRASSQGEILTPSNTTIKDASSIGSASVQASRIDKTAIFVDKSGARLFELGFAATDQSYASSEFTKYHPDILKLTVIAMAVQRAPMTRVWLVLADGTGACLTLDKAEEIIAWSTIDTDGLLLDVAVLPANGQDEVYFHVQRTVAGTKRYLERLATEDSVRGGTFNRVADSFKAITQSSSVSVTGLSHITGKNVVVWGNSKPFVDAVGEPVLFLVGASTVTLSEPVTNVVVGLGFTAQIKSSKLAYAGQLGTALSQKKRVQSVGLILYRSNLGAVSFGRDFTNMDRIPLLYDNNPLNTQTTLLTSYDAIPLPFPGNWSADSRLCLQTKAPYATTIMGVAFGIETTEKG